MVDLCYLCHDLFLLLFNQYVVTYVQYYRLYNILQIIKCTTYRFTFGTVYIKLSQEFLLGHISNQFLPPPPLKSKIYDSHGNKTLL